MATIETGTVKLTIDEILSRKEAEKFVRMLNETTSVYEDTKTHDLPQVGKQGLGELYEFALKRKEAKAK